MLKKIAKGVSAIVLAAVVLVALLLSWTHYSIRQERPELPDPKAIAAADRGEDRPVRLSYVNTASQTMPRSAVLDPGRDRHSNDLYIMSFPSFVLEWADGRMLLIDLGMSREEAASFGRPLELVAEAMPMETRGPVEEKLGSSVSRVQGALFTHLHPDHVQGVTGLCKVLGHSLPVFLNDGQIDRANYTTQSGLTLLRGAGCVKEERLSGDPVKSVPGFPGVFTVRTGGHTPGTQIIVAFVQTAEGIKRYAFTGDIVNNVDGVNFNIPKPLLYSILVVPEDTLRLKKLRRYLKRMRDEHGFSLLVSHDQRQLEMSGIQPFGAGSQREPRPATSRGAG